MVACNDASKVVKEVVGERMYKVLHSVLMRECPYPTDCWFKLHKTALGTGKTYIRSVVNCMAYTMRVVASMYEDVPFRNWDYSTMGIRYTNKACPPRLHWTRRDVLGIPGNIDFGIG